MSYRRVQQQKVTIETAEGTRTTEWVSGYGLTTHVRQVHADGSAWLDVTFDWIRCATDTDGVKFAYDSSKTTGKVPAPAQRYAALLGHRFAVRVSPAGDVVALDGVDILIGNVMVKLGRRELPQLESDRQALRRLISLEGIRYGALSFLAFHPPKPVAVNGTWSRRADLTAAAPMVYTGTFTLRKRADGVATVAFRSTIANHPTNPVSDGPAGRTEWKHRGAGTGSTEIDEATGCIVRHRHAQTSAGTKTLLLPGGQRGAPERFRIERSVTVERCPREALTRRAADF